MWGCVRPTLKGRGEDQESCEALLQGLACGRIPEMRPTFGEFSTVYGGERGEEMVTEKTGVPESRPAFFSEGCLRLPKLRAQLQGPNFLEFFLRC